jgi:hypothetical protein
MDEIICGFSFVCVSEVSLRWIFLHHSEPVYSCHWNSLTKIKFFELEGLQEEKAKKEKRENCPLVVFKNKTCDCILILGKC